MFCDGLTLTSGTQLSPEPSQPSCMERTPKHAPMPKNRAEQAIASEPSPHKMSDQVCKPATSSAVGMLVLYEGIEEDPTHTLTTDGELLLTFGGYFENLDEEISLFLPFPMVPPLLYTTGPAPHKLSWPCPAQSLLCSQNSLPASLSHLLIQN